MTNGFAIVRMSGLPDVLTCFHVLRSYGKGLIQSVYQLEDGSALIMTVGKYLTPSMIDIDRQGIMPDFARLPSPESAMSRLAQCQAPGLAPA